MGPQGVPDERLPCPEDCGRPHGGRRAIYLYVQINVFLEAVRRHVYLRVHVLCLAWLMTCACFFLLCSLSCRLAPPSLLFPPRLRAAPLARPPPARRRCFTPFLDSAVLPRQNARTMSALCS